jgi:hypothetical protein
MRSCLLASIVLALIATTCGAGCTGSPVPTRAEDEPAVVQTPRAEEAAPTVGSNPERQMEAEPASASPTSETTPAALPAGAEALVARTREELAKRLGISVDDIDVVAVIGQEFPADAFYCGTAKERIARDASPVLIPGQTILLSAAGRRYEYHANDEAVIFCRQLRSGRQDSSGWP